jgi:tmRNA-binding protein
MYIDKCHQKEAKKEIMMHYFHRYLFYFIILLWCANWSEQGSNIDGRKKQAINFTGTLITQQGDEISIENISIGRLYKQIPVYEMPLKTEKKLTLDKNPLEGIITRIDLAEISELLVPEPEKIWYFQKKERSRKTEYIEITIVSKDTEHTTRHYLIELGRKIICDEVNAAGPIEKDIPLSAVKKLQIKGFTIRDTKQSLPIVCPPCPIAKNKNP